MIPADMHVLLVEHKPTLLAAKLSASWNPVEADQILAEARGVLASAEAEHKGERLSAARLNLIRIWLEVVEDTFATIAESLKIRTAFSQHRVTQCRGTLGRLLGTDRAVPR